MDRHETASAPTSDAKSLKYKRLSFFSFVFRGQRSRTSGGKITGFTERKRRRRRKKRKRRKGTIVETKMAERDKNEPKMET